MFFTAASLLSALALGASAKVYDIQVGGANGTLEFSPEAIFADVGDQVVFHFHPKVSSVTHTTATCARLLTLP
jgi:plastocyanin